LDSDVGRVAAGPLCGLVNLARIPILKQTRREAPAENSPERQLGEKVCIKSRPEGPAQNHELFCAAPSVLNSYFFPIPALLPGLCTVGPSGLLQLHRQSILESRFRSAFQGRQLICDE